MHASAPGSPRAARDSSSSASTPCSEQRQRPFLSIRTQPRIERRDRSFAGRFSHLDDERLRRADVVADEDDIEVGAVAQLAAAEFSRARRSSDRSSRLATRRVHEDQARFGERGLLTQQRRQIDQRRGCRGGKCGAIAAADRHATGSSLPAVAPVARSAARCRSTLTLRSSMPGRVTSSSNCGRRISRSVACRLASNVFTEQLEQPRIRDQQLEQQAAHAVRLHEAKELRQRRIGIDGTSRARRATSAAASRRSAASAARRENSRGLAQAARSFSRRSPGLETCRGAATLASLSCGRSAMTRLKMARTRPVCSARRSQKLVARIESEAARQPRAALRLLPAACAFVVRPRSAAGARRA